jgi:hypothetical protein
LRNPDTSRQIVCYADQLRLEVYFPRWIATAAGNTRKKKENANAWAPQISRLPKLDWPGMTQSGTVEVSETRTLR